jgi:hypothetical protein
VLTSVTNLDNDKVDKAGDTMTGSLVLPSMALTQDGSNNVTLFISNSNNTVERGSIRFSSNTNASINLVDNSSSLEINSLGDTRRTTSGEIRPIAFATNAGYETSVAANSSVTVNFDSGRFTQIPIVLITPVTTATTATTGHVGNISTSSFTLYNTTNATRNFFWQAIQMASNSAAG